MAVVFAPNPNPPIVRDAFAHLCPRCRRATWQSDVCLLCQKGAATRD